MSFKFTHIIILVGVLMFNACQDSGNNNTGLLALLLAGSGTGTGTGPKRVTGVILNKNTTSVPIGSTEQLTARISPADADNRSVTWTTTDSGKVTVSTDGLVTAVAAGSATITATTSDGGFFSTCLVTATVKASGVALNKSTTSINIGSTEQLTATVAPANASDQNVAWTTSDAGKAIVSSTGLVTAVGVSAGSATITATTADGGFTGTCTVTVNAAPVFSADGVSFKMAYVPGMTFPTGTDDKGTATVTGGYWIGETEVTYELWRTVIVWAGGHGYSFANYGREGNDGVEGAAMTAAKLEPVTTISWNDAMVFCNALTDWYNAKNGTSYTRAYYYAGSPIVNSACGGLPNCNPVTPVTGTGFRLPSANEWELAARWRSDATNTVASYSYPWFTTGVSASGATADYNDATATSLVAIYNANSGSKTAAVKSRAANSLGLCDMSGNVTEFCFDKDASDATKRVRRGGDWYWIPSYTQVGYIDSFLQTDTWIENGFRLAKPQ